MPALARNALSALALLASSFAFSAHAEPAVHAVVVGVNKYLPPIKSLYGAVADAEDIAAAFNQLGVKPLLLREGEATRAAVLAGLNGMLDRARPGDVVVFTYAGHGDLSKTFSADQTEATGKDQFILLAGAALTAPGDRERILDDEIGAWLDRATAKGLRPVVVFDSCHSGTMYRSFDMRAGLVSVRSAEFPIGPIDALAAEAGTVRRSQQLPAGAFSYAAAQDSERVEEITYSNRYRGAFSIAFAEALRGQADANRDGWVTHGEMRAHLLGRTRALMDGKQTPNMEPAFQNLDAKLFRVGGAAVAASAPTPVRLRINGLTPAAAADLARKLDGVTLTINPNEPIDLVWDAQKSVAVTANGDIAALEMPENRVGELVQKWRALHMLKTAARRPALVMRALPDDRARKKGEEFGFAVEAMNGQALTVFNLASDGTINFLYPKNAGDLPKVSGDYRNERFTEITSPFGADHLIAVATSEVPAALQGLLKKYDGQSFPILAAEAALQALAGDPKARIGIQAMVSQPK